MRTWFWTLLLAVVAVGLAVVLQSHTGNVLILVPPHRIELSLTLAVLLFVGSFVLLYVLLRLLAWLLAIPSRVRDWRGRRAQARDHELMEKGWVGLLEGRFANAEKQFSKLIDQTRVQSRRSVAALSAARAAHELGEYPRRDALLDQAREAAGTDPGLTEAVATVSADMLLDQGQPARALTVLAPLQDGARHLHTTRLLLRAESELGHHDQVFTLARALARRHAIAKPESEKLIDISGAARLRAGTANGDGWRVIWKDMKAVERTYPEIALAGSQAFDAADEPEEAARVLEAAIARQFTPALVAAYARCPATQVKRRIDKAETWLQQRPNDPDLLRVLGLLCLTGQIWGAAERYLTRSLKYRSDPQTHALLGSLYDRLNRPEEAARHWRMATAVGMALPTLANDGFLPSAEIGDDPHYTASEVADLDDIYSAQGLAHDRSDTLVGDAALNLETGSAAPVVPLPASSTDHASTPVVAPVVASAGLNRVAVPVRPDAPPAHEVSTPKHADFDEYFDSAPPSFTDLDDTGRTDRNEPARDDTSDRTSNNNPQR
ncbi:MAG: heme biosynthesis HemY N-terminal domain-containing protein [Burkholderiaceae bacterium]